jgi:hypothetical protein
MVVHGYRQQLHQNVIILPRAIKGESVFYLHHHVHQFRDSLLFVVSAAFSLFSFAIMRWIVKEPRWAVTEASTALSKPPST